MIYPDPSCFFYKAKSTLQSSFYPKVKPTRYKISHPAKSRGYRRLSVIFILIVSLPAAHQGHDHGKEKEKKRCSKLTKTHTHEGGKKIRAIHNDLYMEYSCFL